MDVIADVDAIPDVTRAVDVTTAVAVIMAAEIPCLETDPAAIIAADLLKKAEVISSAFSAAVFLLPPVSFFSLPDISDLSHKKNFHQ